MPHTFQWVERVLEPLHPRVQILDIKAFSVLCNWWVPSYRRNVCSLCRGHMLITGWGYSQGQERPSFGHSSQSAAGTRGHVDSCALTSCCSSWTSGGTDLLILSVGSIQAVVVRSHWERERKLNNQSMLPRFPAANQNCNIHMERQKCERAWRDRVGGVWKLGCWVAVGVAKMCIDYSMFECLFASRCQAIMISVRWHVHAQVCFVLVLHRAPWSLPTWSLSMETRTRWLLSCQVRRALNLWND